MQLMSFHMGRPSKGRLIARGFPNAKRAKEGQTMQAKTISSLNNQIETLKAEMPVAYETEHLRCSRLRAPSTAEIGIQG
jgi:hypothetical protein